MTIVTQKQLAEYIKTYVNTLLGELGKLSKEKQSLFETLTSNFFREHIQSKSLIQ
ncbi:hypothetical protein C5S31_07885, partial [ANME-1 cluster archaeon GoMg2]|nr:hypothetical protein [ANME-1 cluster archaeon GoMg2]